MSAATTAVRSLLTRTARVSAMGWVRGNSRMSVRAMTTYYTPGTLHHHAYVQTPAS